mgnify:CR=1 FL=1
MRTDLARFTTNIFFRHNLTLMVEFYHIWVMNYSAFLLDLYTLSVVYYSNNKGDNMRSLKYNLWWKRQSIKRWWSNKSQADRWFIYMNLLFILMTCGVPIIGMLLGIEM